MVSVSQGDDYHKGASILARERLKHDNEGLLLLREAYRNSTFLNKPACLPACFVMCWFESLILKWLPHPDGECILSLGMTALSLGTIC